MEFIEQYAADDGSDDKVEISIVGGDEVTTYSDGEFIHDRESVQDQDDGWGTWNGLFWSWGNWGEHDLLKNFGKKTKKFEEDLYARLKQHFFMQFLMEHIIQDWKIRRNLLILLGEKFLISSNSKRNFYK